MPEVGRVDMLYPSNCCCTGFCPVPDEIADKSTALLNLLKALDKMRKDAWKNHRQGESAQLRDL